MSKDGKDPKRYSAVNLLTPMGAIRRAATALGRAAVSVKQTAREMKASLPDQAREGKFPEGDLRNITDAKERFMAMYELHNWSESDLEKQTRTLKRTKLTAMCVSLFALSGVVILAIYAPLWMSIFLIPASGSLLILGFAQAFKYALFETQIDMREFISARQFVHLDDFWPRFFG